MRYARDKWGSFEGRSVVRFLGDVGLVEGEWQRSGTGMRDKWLLGGGGLRRVAWEGGGNKLLTWRRRGIGTGKGSLGVGLRNIIRENDEDIAVWEMREARALGCRVMSGG